MKYHILLGYLAVAAAYPGIIHDEVPHAEEKYDGPIGESQHQHHIQHEHAKSHQSIKFEHFHPVPVYVKKEYSHLLKDPLHKGKSEHDLKQVHPETEHKYGGGLVLEDYRFNTDHHHSVIPHGAMPLSDYSHGAQGSEGGYGGDYSGYESAEGLKGFEGHYQPASHGSEGLDGHYQYAEHGHSLTQESGDEY